ncbi:MAG: DUF2948 family protein [Rhodobacteraceae bacterium]|nr:DUF2948 family protein [Paracoccaceae bacterium]
MTDASFEDGAEKPLRLVAFAEDDLEVLSSLAQDAIFPATEMAWKRKDRRFAILINRFRWEDADAASRRSRSFERVQSVLTVEQVEGVRSQGVERDANTVLSLLSVSFEARGDAAGTVILTFAGDGAIAVDVEALEVTLRDVTRPYVAPSKSKPGHDV